MLAEFAEFPYIKACPEVHRNTNNEPSTSWL